MNTEPTYSLFMATDVACRILGVDPVLMLETAGLGELPYGRTELRVTAQQYFDCWNTMEVLSPRPDYVPHLGIAISRGPVIPVFFTLSCAPDMETGLMRLAQFKTLLGPTLMRVFWEGELLTLEFDSADARVPMPPSLGALQLVVALENIRGAAAHHICPVAAGFDGSQEERRMIAGHLGIMPEHSHAAFVAFSPDDAKRRFISENPALWSDIEADLRLQLAAQNDRWPIADRVRGALVDLMPAGRTGAEDVAFALGISRSTLQRRLRDAGTSYQGLLDATRRDMAIRYLTKTNLRADEIASVLAYRDANSFSRSFRRWTGQAPSSFRQTLSHSQFQDPESK
ncbi:AraC family transcriptional regulator [Roseivivax halodurans JCM 10272]|uniref:AraC family transcriptional regulator n=1 Tax=Roseivivax halodurans JCM 10272 TaxID=1449350 RepID=X7E9S8_9RHOB|nr:AraC family transcriptional regulator [Roseivivax halodurans]ETX12839.1 AraC family transcriptional regulator [Roseivivax halodurans JCM 10272]